MAESTRSHKQAQPTPEQLAALYPRALTHDERAAQNAMSQARREAKLPQHLALRTSALLTAVPFAVIASIHFINIILQLAGVLSAVCFSFLIITMLGCYIIASVGEINGYFIRRNQPAGPFWVSYSVIITILTLLISAAHPLTIASLLITPWYVSGGVVVLHGIIAYGLAGRWLGWQR